MLSRASSVLRTSRLLEKSLSRSLEQAGRRTYYNFQHRIRRVPKWEIGLNLAVATVFASLFLEINPSTWLAYTKGETRDQIREQMVKIVPFPEDEPATKDKETSKGEGRAPEKDGRSGDKAAATAAAEEEEEEEEEEDDDKKKKKKQKIGFHDRKVQDLSDTSRPAN